MLVCSRNASNRKQCKAITLWHSYANAKTHSSIELKRNFASFLLVCIAFYGELLVIYMSIV
jgi:hypothetical protein